MLTPSIERLCLIIFIRICFSPCRWPPMTVSSWMDHGNPGDNTIIHQPSRRRHIPQSVHQPSTVHKINNMTWFPTEVEVGTVHIQGADGGASQGRPNPWDHSVWICRGTHPCSMFVLHGTESIQQNGSDGYDQQRDWHQTWFHCRNYKL